MSLIFLLSLRQSSTYPQAQGDKSTRTPKHHAIDDREFRGVSSLVGLFLDSLFFLSFVIADLDGVRLSDLGRHTRCFRWEASARSVLRLI